MLKGLVILIEFNVILMFVFLVSIVVENVMHWYFTKNNK